MLNPSRRSVTIKKYLIDRTEEPTIKIKSRSKNAKNDNSIIPLSKRIVNVGSNL